MLIVINFHRILGIVFAMLTTQTPQTEKHPREVSQTIT
jgi:hypothetical protein